MSKPKLSDIMKRGAAVTEPLTGKFFDDTQQAACAIGCIMVAEFIDDYLNLPDDIRSQLEKRIEIDSLPDDIRNSIRPYHRDGFSDIALQRVITIINDHISRARAIQLTAELGY